MSRPRTFDDVARRSISVRVTDEQRRELEAVAAENGTRLTTVIRDAVNE